MMGRRNTSGRNDYFKIGVWFVLAILRPVVVACSGPFLQEAQQLRSQSRVRQKPTVSTLLLRLDIYLGKVVCRPTNVDVEHRGNWRWGQHMTKCNAVDYVWWTACTAWLSRHHWKYTSSFQEQKTFGSLSQHTQWQSPALSSGQDLAGCALCAGSQLPPSLIRLIQAY